MAYLVLSGLCAACFLSVVFRVILSHPFSALFYGVRDAVAYFRYRRWNDAPAGRITCYAGLFGKGKTLSAVHRAVSFYRRYDNLKVFDPGRGKWVTQKVHIISNVDLAIPFERFVSLSQIVAVAETMRARDAEAGTRTVTLVLGDEFSVQLNSRSFKDNIDPLFLNTLLTCRHHHISLVYTAQRFSHVDALLRQVTSHVITCDKCWRVMVHRQYDAYEMENASDPTNVRVERRSGWFIRDGDFAAYDTLACVGRLAKSCREGDMLSEAEILALQQNSPSDMDAVTRPSRKYMRRQKKMHK